MPVVTKKSAKKAARKVAPPARAVRAPRPLAAGKPTACFLPTPADEPGYYVEVFSAVGDAAPVLTVPESHLEPLRSDEVLTVRSLAARAA